MENENYLQVYDLQLTTTSPLFVGDGGMIPKKTYLFDSRSGEVSLLDERKFFSLLMSRGLSDAYEQFMMGESTNLYLFLVKDCGLTKKDWDAAVRCRLRADSALDAAHSLKDIHTFVRDGQGRVYIPGSSVKGALRTVLLQQMILSDPQSGKSRLFDPRSFDREIAGKYLHTLKLNQRKSADMINSIMRGIQVSDSMPVPDSQMMLAMKSDVHVDGSIAGGRGIVCRESICPGTVIRLKLTLDQSVLKNQITKESLKNAILSYDEYYWNTYATRFAEPEDVAEVYYEDSLLLGGGSGFFAKTLVYPYLGEEKALVQTAEMMQRSFRKHHHERDIDLGISPHTMEYSKYGGKYYPMGLCEVKIL